MKSDLPSLRLLVLITDIGIDRKIDRLLCELHLPVYYQFRGQGTAKTELLDICGMQGTARVITVTILPKQMVGTVFERLEKKFLYQKKRTRSGCHGPCHRNAGERYESAQGRSSPASPGVRAEGGTAYEHRSAARYDFWWP